MEGELRSLQTEHWGSSMCDWEDEEDPAKEAKKEWPPGWLERPKGDWCPVAEGSKYFKEEDPISHVKSCWKVPQRKLRIYLGNGTMVEDKVIIRMRM